MLKYAHATVQFTTPSISGEDNDAIEDVVTLDHSGPLIPTEDLDQVHVKDVQTDDDDENDGGQGGENDVSGDIVDGDKPALLPPGAQEEKPDSVSKRSGYKPH